MFSLNDLPVQLDGISFSDMRPGGAFSPFKGENSDFSRIMDQLQQFEVENSGAQPAEYPAMLEDFGLSHDHVKMLQQLLSDGNSLPEAAVAVLDSLKKQLAEMLKLEPSAQQVETMENLQEEISSILELLPAGLREQIESGMQEFRQMIENLKEELGGLNLSAQESSAETPSSLPGEASNSPTDQDGGQLHGQHSDENEAAIHTTQDASENDQQDKTVDAVEHAVLINNSLHTGNSQAKDRKVEPGGNAQSTVAMLNAANKPNNGNGAVLPGNETGHVDPDADFDLLAEGKPVAENRIMPNPANQQSTSRIVAQLQVNEQAIRSQASTSFSGQGSGSNLQSGANNTSYTQLMTQTMPSPVTQNIHKPEWGNAIGQRITWMIGNKLQGAQVRITPAHLGPVDIKLSIENGVAQVSFVSSHQVVRDALEQAVPRLRDMLENQNLELGDVDISDRSLSDSHKMRQEFAHSQGAGAGSAEETGLSADSDQQAVTQVLHSDSLLDAYA